jgi:histidine ammonia-lyase
LSSTVTLDGRGGVTIADVVHVARGGAPVALHADARARVVAARAIVDAAAASDTSIYGLTSALGANTGAPLSAQERTDYQLRAVRARAVAVGAALPADAVRAMMLARSAGMAAGGSGVSPAVLDALIALLNAGVHPVVPSIGSIGAADLPQLSHLALPLVGEGRAEFRGEVWPGATALQRAGLKPVTLGPKDGLALISANAAGVGCAALALHDAARALDTFTIGAALAYEGFRANLGPLDPRVQAARPARGQLSLAARLRELLDGSALWHSGAARRVQDPLSLRCVTQVHGAALAALQLARDDVELELNSAAESPLVLADAPHLVSNGNFHIPALAQAIDGARLALAHVAQLALMRCQKLYAPALSGLPLQLTSLGPAHSGFATVQKTLVSLLHRVRALAQPASLDSLPVSEATEDDASMAFDGVAQLNAMQEPLRLVAAIEWLSAAQAVDLRPVARDQMGAGAAAAYALVRGRVPMLHEDRPLGPEIDAVAAAIDGSTLPTPHGLAR